MLSYSEVLEAAQQLPDNDQQELAATLLEGLHTDHANGPHGAGFAPLGGMSVEELRALAEAVVAPAHQEELRALLEKNRQGTLSSQEEASLDRLLAETDQVALLKARALYTLKLRDRSPGPL
jgi:hypothetical protein